MILAIVPESNKVTKVSVRRAFGVWRQTSDHGP